MPIRNRERLVTVSSRAAFVAGLGALALVVGMRAETEPAINYYHDLTKPGECLFYTDYDTKNGAEIEWGQQTEDDVRLMTIKPRNNSRTSEVTLLFEDTFTVASGNETARALFEKCLQN